MLPETYLTQTPDRILAIMEVPLGIAFAESLAHEAVEIAKADLPKISGRTANSLIPVFGETFWGIHFPLKTAGFLERGTNPFTMNSLAGKVIPMWVEDPDGEVAKENKNAKTRITLDGRKQTLIFRRAAKKGERKMVYRNGQWVSVPKSYPGAPGRINMREPNGRIGRGNGGVRWRHPGIEPRHYLNNAMDAVVENYDLDVDRFILVDSSTYSMATRE